MNPRPAVFRSCICLLALALSACGCSVLGFVGGSGIDAIRHRHPRELTNAELAAVPEGTLLTIVTDSSTFEGRRLAPGPADSLGDTLSQLRVLLPPGQHSQLADTGVVALAAVRSATTPKSSHASKAGVKGGAKADFVILKVLAAVAVAVTVIGLLFYAILASSNFSFG